MREGSVHTYFLSFLRGFLLIFLVLFIMSTSTYSTLSTPTTTVSVFPSTVTASTGQNFSMNVTISSVLDLYAWEFKLSWNATLLDVVNATEGSFLKTGGKTFFYYNVNETAGCMVVDCTLLGGVSGVSGNGTLATITFHVKNVGECPLHLYNVIFINSLEQTIPSQTSDGYGYFTASIQYPDRGGVLLTQNREL